MALDEKLAPGGDSAEQKRYGDLVEDILCDFAQLDANRCNFETQWEEVAELVIPQNRGLFKWSNVVTPGEKRTDRQVDTTAQRALSIFVSIVDSLLTPEDTLWHILGNPDESLMRDRQVRLWLEAATKRLFSERYEPTAGFSDNNQKVWQSVGAFGTGVNFIDPYVGPNGRDGLRYRNIPIQEAYIKENHQGVVDTMIRAFMMTPRQAQQKWGDALPEQVLVKAQSKTMNEGALSTGGMCRFLHAVRPRTDWDPDRLDERGKFWESVYISWDAKTVLSTGGYSTFPYGVARYDVAPNEVYGRGPAMQVLPEIKTINLQKKTLLKSAHRAVDPVIFTADDGLVDISYKPGVMNKGGVNADGKALFATLPQGKIEDGIEVMNLDAQNIKDPFLVNLFQILTETPTMTATEVIERTREKATLMAPPLSRMASSYLGLGLIPRELDILASQGKLPPMPLALRRAKDHYKVVYTSPLARAKMAEQASGTLRTIESIINVVNITQDPAPLDKFNFDNVTDFLAETNAVPTRLMASQDEVDQKRKARAQAAAAQHEVQAAPAAAALLKAKAVAGKAGVQPQAMPRTPFPTAPIPQVAQ